MILGIDPGSVVTGYGVIEHHNRKNQLVTCGCLRPDRRLPFAQRLLGIYDGLLALVSDVSPDEVALETVFYGANVQTMMKMCHARGVIMLALANSSLPVFEYSPREVKKAVVGKGSAAKEQVQFMVQRIFNEDDFPGSYDVTDAVAIALCHAHQKVSPLGRGGRRKNDLAAKLEAARAKDKGNTRLAEKLRALGIDAKPGNAKSKRRGR